MRRLCTDEVGGRKKKTRYIMNLMESISKLESFSLASTLLEELGEWMTTRETSALEGMTTLLGHWIVRVIPIVKPLSQFWVREDLIRLVDSGHLCL